MADSPAATTEEEFDFTSAMGADNAEAAQKKYAGSGDRIPFFALEDKGSAIVRFITDAFTPSEGDENFGVFPYTVPWITVDQHSMVPTKPQPKGYEGNWPKSMSCVCRKDKVFKAKYGDRCYVCENVKKQGGKPNLGSPRTWALVCLREEVKGTQEMVDAKQIPASAKGKVVAIRDKTREIKKVDAEGKETGEVRLVKDVQVLNLGWKNFFASLQGMAGRYQTVLDRDFEITRKGSDTSTIYQITPLDPIQTADPDDKDKKVVLDLRDRRFMARYADSESEDVEERIKAIPDLRKTVARLASDDFYSRFIDPTMKRDDEDSSDSSAQPAGSPAAPSGTDVPDGDALAALKDRVSGYNPDDDAAASPPAEGDGDKPAEEGTKETATAGAAAGGGMMDFG